MYSVTIIAHAFWNRKHSPVCLKRFPLIFRTAKIDLVLQVSHCLVKSFKKN